LNLAATERVKEKNKETKKQKKKLVEAAENKPFEFLSDELYSSLLAIEKEQEDGDKSTTQTEKKKLKDSLMLRDKILRKKK